MSVGDDHHRHYDQATAERPNLKAGRKVQRPRGTVQ